MNGTLSDSKDRYSQLVDLARTMAEKIRESQNITLVSHIDADGLSSCSIAKKALDRLGINAEIKFIRNIDDPTIELISKNSFDYAWFVDLGSGSMRTLRKYGVKSLITDHHVPDEYEIPKESRTDLLKFAEEAEDPLITQVNPHMCDLNGSYEISGAGCTFLVARELDRRNEDLVRMAIVGAIGDVQDSNSGILEGMNREFIEIGKRHGILDVKRDLTFFGRTSRPLYRFLELSGDVYIPGITNNFSGAIKFLKSLNISVKNSEGKWRTYNDLAEGERKTLIAALVERLIKAGESPDLAFSIIGETYIFPDEDKSLPVWDAKEFSTLLNSCGRYEKGEVGIAVAMGDRGKSLHEALSLLKDHRKNLILGYDRVISEGLKSLKSIDYFYAGNSINDNIIGIIANMVLSGNGEKNERPLMTMADSPDGMIKISMRAAKTFLKYGIDLAEVVRINAEKNGGVGGGHDLAAGGTVPSEKREKFLNDVDYYISNEILKQKNK